MYQLLTPLIFIKLNLTNLTKITKYFLCFFNTLIINNMKNVNLVSFSKQKLTIHHFEFQTLASFVNFVKFFGCVRKIIYPLFFHFFTIS